MIYLAYIIAAEVEGTSGIDWVDTLATYGLAAPFLLFTLYVIRELRKDLTKRDDKINELTVALTDKVIPLVTESNSVLKETAEILREAQHTTKEAIQAQERLNAAASRLEELVNRWRSS